MMTIKYLVAFAVLAQACSLGSVAANEYVARDPTPAPSPCPSSSTPVTPTTTAPAPAPTPGTYCGVTFDPSINAKCDGTGKDNWFKVSVSGVGEFCTEGPICSGSTNKNCPGPRPGLPYGSRCASVYEGVYACVANKECGGKKESSQGPAPTPVTETPCPELPIAKPTPAPSTPAPTKKEDAKVGSQ
ncbi:TPA: hypothetical protein N0F65_010121 [Lagenidium giganteum]|uniref:Uncharacterized protein n=1 Tax=Lagenidium giganteum TaxID=4803 RepID=A0AAV2YLE3_9STRA|nr:TPA: hypothetical protein N0F65_010121 [Lagenidium giganteum]